MKETFSPLFSQYILDGQQMEETPFNALYDCLDGNGSFDMPKGPFASIVDEYMDKAPTSFAYEEGRLGEYIAQILHSRESRSKVDLAYPVGWTRQSINALLMDTLFKEGHFVLQDLLLMARWDWNNSPAGNMAAFYDSTVTAGHYLFDLGVRLDRYFVEENRKDCLLEWSIRSKIRSRRACPDILQNIPDSWVLYIPFENSRPQLGGSALSKVVGCAAGAEMEPSDPDYFMDCYEVVREFIEDGVVLSGAPIGRGGLAVAAEKYRGRSGMQLEIGGIKSATGESDSVKILFAEKAGVLVQISDGDYDYVDSQLLLQDVAYYPVSRGRANTGGLSVSCTNRDSVSGILDALLSQASEGED